MNQEFDLVKWHQRNHFRRWYVPQTECWFCQRGAVICKAKDSYPDPRVANETARMLNHQGVLNKPVMPYRCPFCRLWHLTSRLDKTHAKRAEKWRRKDLVKELTTDGSIL